MINTVTADSSDSIVIRDSQGNPTNPPVTGVQSKNISSLITVTSDNNATTYEYDPLTDGFKVIDSASHVVGEVTLTKVDGDFDFSDGAVIDPHSSMAPGSTGHIDAVLKDPNSVVIGTITFNVTH